MILLVRPWDALSDGELHAHVRPSFYLARVDSARNLGASKRFSSRVARPPRRFSCTSRGWSAITVCNDTKGDLREGIDEGLQRYSRKPFFVSRERQ